MKRTIDCFFIGHNEMSFDNYEKTVRLMGENSGAYRDLTKSVLQVNNTAYSITEIINLVNREKIDKGEFVPFNMLETHSNSIAYLCTYLHRRGKTFDYINSFQAEKEYLREIITKNNVLSIGIITTLYVSIFPIAEIMEYIKSINDKIPVIIGGPFVSTQVRTQEPTCM